MRITAHELGYRAYQNQGLTARNPFGSDDPNCAAEWARGFAKAKAKYATHQSGKADQ